MRATECSNKQSYYTSLPKTNEEPSAKKKTKENKQANKKEKHSQHTNQPTNQLNQPTNKQTNNKRCFFQNFENGLL